MDLSRQVVLVAAILGLGGGSTVAEPGPAKEVPPAAPVPPISGGTTPLADGSCPGPVPSCVVLPAPLDEAAGRFLGGVGLYLIQPYFENNPAYFIIRDSRAGSFTRTGNHVDVKHHVEVAPQVWLGYVGDGGLGGRARYWYFREGTNETLAEPAPRTVTANPLGLLLFANPGQMLNVTTKLEVQVADLEVLQELQAGRWEILLAGGVRLARLSQAYNAFVAPVGNGVEALVSGHTFQGAGPVLASEVRRPLGDSSLSLFGSARGALLFGSAEQRAAVAFQRNAGVDHRDRGLLVGELELGLEYARETGPSRLFGQVALVGQNWFGAGSASRSALQVGPGGDFTGGGYTLDSDIAFFGVSFRLGLNY